MHTFDVRLTWTGSTDTKDFDHDGEATAPNKLPIEISTAPGFGGSADKWNPEDLFGASLGNCHLQTFLALAAKVGVDVRAYVDDVEVTIEEVDKVTQVTKVLLRPTITISADSDPAKAEKFFHKAHKYCFIANSTTAEVVLEPTIEKEQRPAGAS